MGNPKLRVTPILVGLAAGLWLALGIARTPIRADDARTKAPEPPIPTGRALRVHLPEDIVTLDWNKSEHEIDLPILLNLQEGLTTLDRHLRPAPSIAESWSYDATGTQLKFKLRSDARWSDGKPVTAHDFVAAWKRILTPANHFTTAYFLYPIKGAEDYAAGRLRSFSDVGVAAKSDTDLEITFREPSWNWIDSTAVPPLYPVREDLVDGAGWLVPGMVTNGPFRYISHSVGQEFILKRRDDYPGAKSNVSELRFEIMGYPEAIQAIKDGKLDVICKLPEKYRPAFRNRADIAIRQNAADGTRKLDFNRDRFPTTDVNVRRALATAIDRKTLLKQIQSSAQAATTLVPPDFPGGGDPKAGIPFDAPAARRAMTLAPRGPVTTSIDLLVPYFDEAKEEDRQIGEELKRQWEAALLVKVRIVLATTVSQYLVIRESGDYNIVLRDFGVESGDPFDPYAAYATGSRFNIKWPDRTFDVLLQEATRARSPSETAIAVRKLDDFLVKETVTVSPLFYTGGISVFRANIRGYVGATWQPYYLKDLFIEE